MRLRSRAPEAVRSLALDERRLAWGIATGGLPLVATSSALHLGDLVVPWVQVEKATWRPPVLTVVEVAEVEGTGTRHVVEVTYHAHLAEVVRARVTASVGWSDVRRLQPRGSVRLVGRRVPGQDALLWQVVYLDGTDPGDPALRAQATKLVAALRATLG